MQSGGFHEGILTHICPHTLVLSHLVCSPNISGFPYLLVKIIEKTFLERVRLI